MTNCYLCEHDIPTPKGRSCDLDLPRNRPYCKRWLSRYPSKPTNERGTK